MGVALQAGVLAGGVVFVPMALAGWHLTRNRVLFFSAVLFIVLAVSVHLLPYLPTVSSIPLSIHALGQPYFALVDSVPAAVAPLCVLHLHDLIWEDANGSMSAVPTQKVEDEDVVSQRDASAPSPTAARHFRWAEAGSACRYRKLNSKHMLDLFRGTWIVVAGDSQLRFVFVSLLDLLMPDANPVRQEGVLKKHESYDYAWEEENIKLEYKWMPFSGNLTNLVVNYRRNLSYPDVLIMGGGLWHMLHVGNSSQYERSLARLRRAVFSLFPDHSSLPERQQPPGRVDGSGFGARHRPQVPHMFWVNPPALVTAWLNTELKRIRLNPTASDQYHEALRASSLLHPGAPLTLIDLERISRGCGSVCTVDGMHYNNVTYQAAVHVMVNSLLIATQQLPAA